MSKASIRINREVDMNAIKEEKQNKRRSSYFTTSKTINSAENKVREKFYDKAEYV